jgi:hypothetical protein
MKIVIFCNLKDIILEINKCEFPKIIKSFFHEYNKDNVLIC